MIWLSTAFKLFYNWLLDGSEDIHEPAYMFPGHYAPLNRKKLKHNTTIHLFQKEYA